MFRTTTVVCIAALAALPACVSQEAHRRVLAANDRLQDEREAMAVHIRDLQRQNEDLSNKVQRLGASAADAAWIADQKAKIKEMIERLQGGGGSLDIPGVSVRQGDEGIIVQVQGEVLFASGQAELTASGRRTLDKILPELQRSGQRLRVEGHTDSDPIVRSRWKTNLRLSSERAISVAQYLTGGGVEASMVSVGGYGEHRPIAAGNDDASKAANRRVEILLLND